MSDLGYFTQLEGGVFGQPDGGNSDPVTRAQLQEASAALNRTLHDNPLSIPETYAGASAGPSHTFMAAGNPPIIGWTCQKDTGNPFRPYTPTGHIPDWTNDVNPAGAGSYDMNPVVSGSFGFDRDNRAPIGDGLLQYEDQLAPDFSGYDVSGALGGDAEY